MIDILLKRINQATIIGVSNLKYEIEKATLVKYGNNIKYILDKMSSNLNMIIYKGDCHEYYVWHIFRVLLSGPKSTLNIFIEITKGDWDTGI